MSSFYPKEFKEAISQLSSKEKDKLIFRLLKKDLALANRLLFELVNTNTVDEERQNIEKRIKLRVQQITNTFYFVGYLNMDVRYLSGEITEHVNRTKDKFGEVSLNLLLLTEVLHKNHFNILKATPGSARNFCVAVIARVFKILILINKLHPDYRLDFGSNFERLGKLISNNKYLMDAAIKNGLDINWVLQGDIPQDIEATHKKIRQLGFLK
ncbi:hypothetical protein [Mariniflexile sp.]|uniref:hypothetical protein n=1 Tax=Mariniflexile sp. TaxID=1979402 RepID=UPI0040476814